MGRSMYERYKNINLNKIQLSNERVSHSKESAKGLEMRFHLKTMPVMNNERRSLVNTKFGEKFLTF